MNVATATPCPPAAGRVRGAGLVSVSTTHTRRFLPLNPDGVDTLFWMADNAIQIDRQLQRVTRLRKGVGVAAKCLEQSVCKLSVKVMVTLTYSGDNRDWKPSHIRDYLTNVRNWHKRLTSKSLKYVWVAELQERGVIHYHCVFWLDKGVTMPKADKRGWWPHGMTRTEKANKPVGYLMSYLSKIETKNVCQFPTGARIYGIGGLDKSGADAKRWVLWPSYLQGNAESGEPYRPAKGGGYLNYATGEYFKSEYAPTGGGYLRFVRVHQHPRKIEAAGPFCWANRTVH